MNRRSFLTSVLVGVGVAPIVLNAKVKKALIPSKYKIVVYGDYIKYTGNKKHAKKMIIKGMNDFLKQAKIKKKNIISIRFMEKKYNKNSGTCDPLRMHNSIAWIIKVKEKT